MENDKLKSLDYGKSYSTSESESENESYGSESESSSVEESCDYESNSVEELDKSENCLTKDTNVPYTLLKNLVEENKKYKLEYEKLHLENSNMKKKLSNMYNDAIEFYEKNSN